MTAYTVTKTKHNGKENQGFNLVRPFGTEEYLFLHFKTPVVFTLFGKEYHLSPDTCIILSPGTPHSFHPDKCELVHNWMHFIPTDADSFSHIKIDVNTFFTIPNSDFITSLVKMCELELINRDELYEELVSAYVASMLIKLKRYITYSIASSHLDTFRRLRLDMYRNPDKYISISDMSAAASLSRSRFSVLYKDFFNVSPKNDIINARISKASYLLSVGTLTLTEISDICGYQSIYHFIRQFRDITGSTPGKYKKSLTISNS